MMVIATVIGKVTMNRFTRRTLAALSATAFAAGMGLAAPATASAAPVLRTAPTVTYISFNDIDEDHLAAIDALADQLNDVLPGEDEVVFVVNKRGPRSAIGLWDPARSTTSLMVECDPATDTWESYLAGSCSGNQESLLP